jgi:indolepyruvate ferredoxin oxidoreductase
VEESFEGPVRLTVQLAPPGLARTDPATGRPRKRAFRGWKLALYPLLAKLTMLRGSLI